MRNWLIVIATIFLFSCADRVKPGRTLFFGCELDVKATQAAGHRVCHANTQFIPFAGNGRSCASCHRPEDNFGLTAETRDALPADDPFFYDQLDEDQMLLRNHGLVHVIGDGLDEFRQTPALNELCTLCDKKGNCESLGLNSDRTRNLRAFTLGAVINHHAISVVRDPGVDFVLPSDKQLDDLVRYMISSNVCKGL